MSEAGKPITLMIIDDHPLLRAGIAAVISIHADIELVGETSGGRNAIVLFRDLQPDVTLMTVQRPVVHTVDAINSIVSEFPQAKIAVLSSDRKEARVQQAINAGACAHLLKNNLHKELVGTVRALAAGRRCLPAEVTVDLRTQVGRTSLSIRERQVLHWVAQGRSNRHVAQLLSISEATVKGHLHNTMNKLGAHNRTHAVTIALQQGIIQVER
ncbi:response regulator transcription factor [Halopseudomonas pelagia]|uniref:response regulator transcription factor n=1 Tax=Halopseudomonas pelagia TaxID=553151 RepID=UPI0003A5ACEC|nr:response regulator transcription factor [Halopseudomonas pelagia]